MSFLSDYHNWLKIADTALPQNLFGYLVQLCLSLLRTDPFTTLPYDNPKEHIKCGNCTGFLGELSERDGERPQITKWIAPHRQVTQLTGDDMHQLLQAAIDSLVAKYPNHVVVRTSVLEKSGDALLLADSVVPPHTIAKNNKKEIAHIHQGPRNGDHSVHLCLSPEDCKEVIRKKWGERMGLAGSLVPQEYLLIYTPRTREEVEVVKRIVEAAIRFMAGVQESAQEGAM